MNFCATGEVPLIPPLDLLSATKELRAELNEVFARFLNSGQYVLGPEVDAFESEYADYCGAGYCAGVSSGLDALHLALRALDIGPGDEAIVASNTYIATWLAVTHAGARVVPVEPDPITFNLDPEKIAERITSRTRAVLATNLYGLPVDYDAIRHITDQAGLMFLVDNAQAAGARYKDNMVGGIADLECHSFYPTKNLGALGEAGAVTTSDEKLAARIRMLRNYGSKQRYHHEMAGFNNRLDELQAAILRVKLRHLDDWNLRRRKIAEIYNRYLSDCSGIIAPQEPEWAQSAWHLYVVRVQHRNAVMEMMGNAGVGCLIHYPVPPHRSPAYTDLAFAADEFPVANDLAESVLSLPMGPHLSEDDAEEVATILKSVVQTFEIPRSRSEKSENVLAGIAEIRDAVIRR